MFTDNESYFYFVWLFTKDIFISTYIFQWLPSNLDFLSFSRMFHHKIALKAITVKSFCIFKTIQILILNNRYIVLTYFIERYYSS